MPPPGGIYLPLDWMAEAGIDPEAFVAAPCPGPELVAIVRRLLGEASVLYARGEAGVAVLPADCRPGILAARHIYAAIGRRVEAAGDDLLRAAGADVGRREAGARRSRAGALGRVPASCRDRRCCMRRRCPRRRTWWRPRRSTVPRRTAWGDGRTGTVIGILAQLEAQDRGHGQGLAV